MRAFPVRLPSGVVYWTVVDEDFRVCAEVDADLQHVRLGRDCAESTTKAYAQSLALYLRWCEARARLAHGCGSVGSDDYTWYRGTWKQVLQHRDGVTVDASGLSPLLRSLGKLIPATRSSNDSYWLSGTRDRQLPTAKRRPGGTRERTRCVGPTVGGFDEAAVHEAGCRWGGHRRLAIAASAARLVPTVTLTPTSDRSLLATVDLTPGTPSPSDRSRG